MTTPEREPNQSVLDWETEHLQRLIVDAPSGATIYLHGLQVIRLLLEKNTAYGDSALSPKRIFSSASPVEQLKVRIDDKLSRLANWPGQAHAAIPEDTLLDLVGYLILLRIAQSREVEI